MKRTAWATLVGLLLLLGAGRLALPGIGHLLVADAPLEPADALVVLNTGMQIYPRLEAAAALYRRGLAPVVVINGGRKTTARLRLEARGFEPCCPWYETRVRILNLLGVPRRDVWAVSAEDAYDTVSEAAAVGSALMGTGVREAIVVTSRFHTRRALWVWRGCWAGHLNVQVAGAPGDGYAPDGWWRDGRQVRWVLAELGGWGFGWGKRLGGGEGDGGQAGTLMRLAESGERGAGSDPTRNAEPGTRSKKQPRPETGEFDAGR